MGDTGDGFSTIFAIFPWIFGAAVVLIVCGWIYGAMKVVRNRRVLREAGIDPGTVGSQLAVRYLSGQAPPTGRPAVRSASDRLAELTDLRDRGLITPEEYQARRSQILDGV
jgi:putative oligomerization/nucleic acid binding protein